MHRTSKRGVLVPEGIYRNGTLSEHSRSDGTDPGGVEVTLIVAGAKRGGRITALTRAGAVTRYGYDGADKWFRLALTGTGPGPSTSTMAWAPHPADPPRWVLDRIRLRPDRATAEHR